MPVQFIEQLKSKIDSLVPLYAQIEEKPYGTYVTMARKILQSIKSDAQQERIRLITEAKKAKKKR